MFSKLSICTRLLALTGFFFLTGYSSCDPVLQNNGFDLWCGDDLCTWQVDKGSIERVPTWHAGDYGVSLLGESAAISQLSEISSANAGCLRFELVVKAELTAELTLELDFYGDGNVDYRQRIPSSDWAEVSYLVPLPTSYQGIRFRVTKEGPGEAILAQIYADDSDECTQPRGTLVNRPDGAWCDRDDVCASGICGETRSPGNRRTCNTCEDASSCSGGQICAAVKPAQAPHLALYLACTAPAQRVMGERCAGDQECITGICTQALCSACADNDDCPSGGICRTRDSDDRSEQTELVLLPYQCDPFAGKAMSEDWCLAAEDCASGVCNGTGDVRVCEIDGRSCDTGADCPDQRACRTIGLASGICQ